jgi:hypothetical protein
MERAHFTVQTNGANWGYNTAWLFFGTGIASVVLAIFYVPETAQRNPAELDEMYEKGIPAWKMKRYVTEVQTKNMAGRQGVGAPTLAHA